MKASAFVVAYAGAGLAAWETVALALVKGQQNLVIPLTTLTLSISGHTAQLGVANDYFAIGDPSSTTDVLRMPFRPVFAQQLADMYGMLLPTPKLVMETWKQAAQKATPTPCVPNQGANLAQYLMHEQMIEQQVAVCGQALVSGIKKDIVVSNIYRPGKVLIYGWIKPDGTVIQGRSNVHGDFYVDYSHGVRLVAPSMVVDGQVYRTEDVYKDTVLSALVSDEGPLHMTRYPTPGLPVYATEGPRTPDFAQQGIQALQKS